VASARSLGIRGIIRAVDGASGRAPQEKPEWRAQSGPRFFSLDGGAAMGIERRVRGRLSRCAWLAGLAMALGGSVLTAQVPGDEVPAPRVTAPVSNEPRRSVPGPVLGEQNDPASAKATPDDRAARIGRWFGFDAVRLSSRYRAIEASTGTLVTNHVQYRITINGALRFDRARHYQLVAGVSTGPTFTSAWSTTGLGTGPFVGVHGVYLKQLYGRAEPVAGLVAQYGGIGVARGEGTEITTYDNDAYLTGGRVTVRRPRQLFVDDLTVTWAYLGDLLDPRVLPRFKHLDEANYYQVLLAKRLSQRLSASADYTKDRGVQTLRQAVRVATPEAGVIDWVRFEQYFRLGSDGAYGFAIQSEKSVGRRGVVGGGYADIDPHYGGLNADKFNRGRRLFALARARLSSEFDLELFFGQAVANDYAIANYRRFDVVVNYNLLRTLQRTSWF
jgi:hypothetical protein